MFEGHDLVCPDCGNDLQEMNEAYRLGSTTFFWCPKEHKVWHKEKAKLVLKSAPVQTREGGN